MLIVEFFKNRELFITGGTGYLGKSLIEKLLRVCPDISKIYILIRTKRDKTPQQRLKEFVNDLAFERLQRERPNAFEKLVPIVGDSFELGLGIGQEDLERLKNVSIIIHGAANVRFDNNLRGSLMMNTRGTHELIKIALTLKNLIALMHISTAYIDPFKSYLEEKLYDAPVDWRTAIKIAETYDDETLEIFKLKYSNFFPNAYSFSKNLSEQIIAEYSEKLPITILRPSVVVQSFKEPTAGFIDNLNGPMGLLVAMGIGISQITYCSGDLIMALIPVDIVTDLTVVSAYRRGLETLQSRKCGLDIRNLTPGKLFTSSLSECANEFVKYTHQDPFQQSLWKPTIFMTTNFYLYLMSVFLINIPMAFLYDGLLMVSKKETMVLKLTRKIVYTSKALGKFSRRFFDFQNDGMWDLVKYIPEEEMKLFGNIKILAEFSDFNEEIKTLYYGIKKYILKEPITSTPASKRRFKMLIIIDKIVKLIILLGIGNILWKLFN